ncbi:MAG: type II secretion system F family protein, partial [Pseudomonadota bacterium]
MGEYSYHAVDANGHSTDGIMTAQDELALEAQLRSIGFWLIDAKEYVPKNTRRKAKVSRRDLADFFTGMSSLLTAGVPIADALKTMTEEAEKEDFQQVLSDIEMNVQAGMGVCDAMEKYPGIFNEQICNLLRAGEYSGNLGESFDDVAGHLEWVDKLVGDVKQASLYPALVVMAVVGLIILLFTFVVPRFSVIFTELEMQLPMLTRGVIYLGEFSQQHWVLVLGWFFGSIAFFKFAPMYSVSVKQIFDRMKLRLPLFGELNRQLVLSRFVHSLGLMLKSGVPVLEALRICRNLVGNHVMEQAVLDAEMAVNQGSTMSDALRKHEIVSSMLLRMIV